MAPPKARRRDALRPLKLKRNFTKHAEGSVLIQQGLTHVLCTASVETGAPRFRPPGQGWVTAEYGMLPRATHTRGPREAARGKQGGRTVEIGRLIGRSLRAAVDMEALGPFTITIDCDVLQADGGTRCASITGGMVALADALRWMKKRKMIEAIPLRAFIAAISVGMIDGKATLDLDYALDSRAEVDLNVVMTDDGRYIELQGTAEREAFTEADLEAMRGLASKGIASLCKAQKQALRWRD